jgi:hypothetical protein
MLLGVNKIMINRKTTTDARIESVGSVWAPIEMNGETLVVVVVNAARRIFAPFAFLTIMVLACPAVAELVRLPPRTILRFDFQGTASFCYDRVPEIIYFQHNSANGATAIESRSLDSNIRTIAQFPDFGGGSSLSCSQDGSTIVALDAHQQRLYILRSSETSVYEFDKSLLYSVHGKYSLLSPDGSMLSVPGTPVHVAGPDILKQMRFLRTERVENAFFDEEGVYVDKLDKDEGIDLYKYRDNDWRLQRSIAKPTGFGVREISRCGSHVIASLSDDNGYRFLTLDGQSQDRAEWLTRIGVTSLLRQYSLVDIGGGYGRCVFPLLAKRDVRNILKGMATFDDEGVERFVLSGPPLAMSGDKIGLSKDGCFAVFGAFKQVPDIPQFTMRQQTVVVSLAARGCKF